MCILCFLARAGFLQTYENLLKEINLHPGSATVDNDQYQVEYVALADRNFNIACETGIRYPSLVAMLNRRSMLWRATVLYHAGMYILVCTEYTSVRTRLYFVCTLMILFLTGFCENCSGHVRLDINLLKPSRLEFVH